jgi:hypothetical protein
MVVPRSTVFQNSERLDFRELAEDWAEDCRALIGVLEVVVLVEVVEVLEVLLVVVVWSVSVSRGRTWCRKAAITCAE